MAVNVSLGGGGGLFEFLTGSKNLSEFRNRQKEEEKILDQQRRLGALVGAAYAPEPEVKITQAGLANNRLAPAPMLAPDTPLDTSMLPSAIAYQPRSGARVAGDNRISPNQQVAKLDFMREYAKFDPTSVLAQIKEKYTPKQLESIKMGPEDGLWNPNTNTWEVEPTTQVENRPTAKDRNNRLRYLDGDRELVYPDVEREEAPRTQEDIFNLEKGLRGPYDQASSAYRDVADSYSRMEALFFNPEEAIQNINFGDAKITDAQGAADIALLTSFMKMVDPGSVVREGEFATAENAGGVDNRLRNTYNRLLEGARLDDEQRKAFLSNARRLYDGQASRQQALNERYRRLGEAYDLTPSRIISPMYEPRIDFNASNKPTPRANPGTAKAQASSTRHAKEEDMGEIIQTYPNAQRDDVGAFIYQGGQKQYIMVGSD